jgi:glycosyltransferase involved in cell wall biosynthesis
MKDLMEQLERLKLKSYELIVIENKLVNEAWNEGVAQAKGRYIFVLNDDIILYNDTIPKMIKALEFATIACPYFKR